MREGPIRCAIYTRKSSEEGLEQDFNSLHAQREACEAYVLSQRHEGWTTISTAYDDGGFSGGSLERPGVKRLMADVEARKVDIVVVYKVDRLTRSLADFAKMVEVFDAAGVSFVSVTQAFNTTTSMGRLTLNVLLSFAQFEREVTGERIRDKIAASKKKGMWMGGFVPLGYAAKDRTLVIVEEEAEVVRTLFRLYLEHGTVREVKEEADRLQLRTKVYPGFADRLKGGLPFSRGHIYRILANPLYVGEIAHRGQTHPGLHPAIIDRSIWDAVQAQLAANHHARRMGSSAEEPSLLSNILFSEAGERLTPTHANKKGRRYRYYEIRPSQVRGTEIAGTTWRIPAPEIEAAVINQITSFLLDPHRLLDAIMFHDLSPEQIRVALERAKILASELRIANRTQRREMLLDLIGRGTLGETTLSLELRRVSLEIRLGLSSEINLSERPPAAVRLTTSLRLKRRGGATKLVIEAHDYGDGPKDLDCALIKAFARGFAWFEELANGQERSIAEIARREGLTGRYVSRMVELALLAPEVVEKTLRGDGLNVSVDALRQARDLPLSWQEQMQDLAEL